MTSAPPAPSVPTETPQRSIVSSATTATSAGPFIKRNSVLVYYILTFAISWGGILFVVGGPGGIPGTLGQIERLMPFAIPFMLLGPTVAGIVMTGLVDGRAGFRDVLARLRTWRVGAGWYALALLTAPLVYAAVLLALSLTSPVFLPGIITSSDKAPFLLTGIAAALMVGFFEELGWTGFAVPRLRLHYGVLSTGLIAGVLWGAWHILTNDLWGAGISSGAVPIALFASVNGFGILVGQLLAFRVLMVWVYEHTGSLLVAMLMHASLTASTFVLGPVGITGVALLSYGFGLAAGMWVVVAVVLLANGGQLAHQPLHARVA